MSSVNDIPNFEPSPRIFQPKVCLTYNITPLDSYPGA